MKTKTKNFSTEISIEDYHSGIGISASRLKKAMKSTSHFFAEEPKEKEQKDYFNMGNAFEDLLLEGGELSDKYWVFNPDNKPNPDATFANKENKEWKKEQYEKNEGKLVLTQDQINDLQGMLKSCSKKHIQAAIQGDLIKQGSGYWDDEETGLLLKTRPDIIKWRNKNSVVIIDVKTAQDGSPEGFAKAFANLGYGIQAAMQVDGIEKVLEVEVAYYCYLVVETKAPYNAQIYTLNPVDIETHKEIYKDLCVKVKAAQDDPLKLQLGYAEDCGNKSGIMELEIPAWYYNKFNK